MAKTETAPAGTTPAATVRATGSRTPATKPGTGPPRWLTAVTAIWLLGYAVVRLAVLAADDLGPLSATGPDLIVLAGLSGVGVLVAALVAVCAQAVLVRVDAPRWTRILVSAVGAVTSAALMIAGATILLDLVGGVLPGLGVVFYPLGAMIRLGCVLAAVLIAAHTWQYWRATSGPARDQPGPRRTPAWVVVIGYLTVAACLVRLAAQFVVGLDVSTFGIGATMVVFEAGFLLAGILLPLALVHRWGRVWPAWVPGLRGRRVPRMLLIVCGAGLGVALVAYFGMATATMVIEGFGGRSPFVGSDGGSDLPDAFYWVSVPAYLLWGIGLVICTLSYARITAPHRGPSPNLERRGVSSGIRRDSR